jgi:hypothetical protein
MAKEIKRVFVKDFVVRLSIIASPNPAIPSDSVAKPTREHP